MSRWRRTDGPLTSELRRQPGHFGLGQVPSRLAPDATTSMICGFCSTGCSLDVHLRDGQAVNLTPTAGHPVNMGMACPKGWEALTPLAAPDRATDPLVRDRKGELVPVTWELALGEMVDRMRGIQAQHGPESVAFLSTGQIPTEEMALLGALTKFGMGVLHGDGNTRQCMATSVAAYKRAFGFDAPPYTYDDFEQSDVIVLVGSNLCITHPIMWERICRNPHGPEVVVIDPRRTETATAATRHLALRPQSDLVLMYGVARQLIAAGHVDRAFVDAHTSGFDDLVRQVEPYTLERVSAETGLSTAEIESFARLVGEGKRVSLWWTMGVNQSHQAVAVAESIIDLALITGNIGRPGTGANSITGQCNAMGSRLFANTTCLLGGHDFANEEHRAKVAGVLGIDPELIPHQASWAYDQIIEGVVDGKIRALWVIATNSAHSWVDQSHLREVFDRLDLLVVQDMYTTTETAERADILLPAAGWGEKEGTFINSERRVGLVKRVSRAPGRALSDFAIFKLVAQTWGCGDMFERWATPEDVFALLGEVSAGQPCDMSGIDGYEMVERSGGIQWPCPAGTDPSDVHHAQRRLFADGRFHHPDGRAQLRYTEPRALPEPTSGRYPFVLLTGRGSSAQWHTETRTAKSPLLRQLAPGGPYVELNPADADELGVAPDDWVILTSPRGSMRAKAFVTATIAPGQVFVPMHDPATNRLTRSELDPTSRQPAYKSSAVDVRPARIPLLVETKAAGANLTAPA